MANPIVSTAQQNTKIDEISFIPKSSALDHARQVGLTRYHVEAAQEALLMNSHRPIVRARRGCFIASEPPLTAFIREYL
jgi:hypothetical protein